MEMVFDDNKQEIPAPVVCAQRILELSETEFEPDIAADAVTLSSMTDNEINRLVAFLKKYPERDVLIEGHTDNTGTKGTNRDLSLKRTNAVGKKLVAQEINKGRITIRGLGEEFPVASDDTAVGRNQNRRVDVIILNEEIKP